MTDTATYRVRDGFTFTDVEGARERTFDAGEVVTLACAVGDAAHQLQRLAGMAVTPADVSAVLPRGKRARGEDA